MDLQSMVQLISTIGFPMAACIWMGMYVKQLTQQYRDDITELSERHKTEMDSMTEAINNNTVAIQLLTQKLNEGRI